MSVNSSYCGEAEQNGPLVGTIPLEAFPLVEFPRVQLTSIAATVTGDHTVVFLGTSQGRLKKILLEGDGDGLEYEELKIQEGFQISRDMKFDSNKTHLFALTNNKFFKIAVSNCERHKTCESCRSAKDPYCGWCSLQRKCSTKAACLFSNHDNRWLSHKSWECIHIPLQFVNPVEIGVKKSTQVAVGIKALPLLQYGDEYLCVFGSNVSVSVGLTSPNEIKCKTPELRHLSGIPTMADHVNITLFIRSTQTGIDFLETVLTFFDCDRHKSCTSCSQSSYECYWCIALNTCLQVDDISSCSDDVVSEHHRCPRLQYIATGQILIPSSVLRHISLAALHLPQTKASDLGYECLIHLTSPPVRIPARRLSSSALICSGYEYNYESDEATKTVSLEVTWNGGRYIDDNFGITITIYKCEQMASDCSSCLSLQEMSDTVKYNCHWCSDRCQSNLTCGHFQLSSICPLPDIQTVNPLSGPLDGGTRLTIKGINLGRNYEQVRHAVRVAGIPCDVVPSEYVVSRLIVCKTGRVSSLRRGSVFVTVGDATVAWETEFVYQNPEVTRMFPVVGPKAGGTTVTIEGHHLDTGANVQVFFLDSGPCHIEYLNSTYIKCRTDSKASPGFCRVMVKFDNSIRHLPVEFEFIEDPSIFEIRPLSAFMSGGRVLTVTGINFNSVQYPMMHLQKKSSKYSSKCVQRNNSVLLCATPVLSGDLSERKVQRSISSKYTISFTMDNVESVQFMSVHYPEVRSELTAYPDPVYNSFEDGIKLYRGEALILTGENLNLACEADEVTVMIGNETCKVNSIDLNTLYCTPPVSQPPHFGTNGALEPNALPLVKVVLGNLVYTLGQLEYQRVASDDSEYWIIGVAFGGGTLLTIIFVILVIYKRKSTKAERQFKKLNLQLDALEINIRNECKQAFAELQTEVSDFTSDLNLIGIPFWDYTTYTYKVLFPNDAIYSSVLTTAEDQEEVKDGLTEFGNFFSNKHFVTVFVRTLEEQRTFTIQDKAKVASLLMIIFHDQLDYATQILKLLLSELIDRSVERKHPKLMLRRTESVVEKLLTNWLAMCLYDYVKSHAGKALFMLYKAIKHQTEKGPIDAITSDARYSLSEDRLLREKTEAKALTVYLISNQQTVDPICCHMLDSDIISQAKEKGLDAIYMNTPFSHRPSIEDIDLEWLSGPNGDLILRDEDASTEVVRGWKKLNTLAHYHVPDGATMALIARHIKMASNGFSTGSSKSSLNISRIISAAERNSKSFHLVLPDEGQNVGRSQKVVSEIFLTRLLATKCTLQQYVDDLFSVILTPDTSSTLSAVKYLFDFLDASAHHHGIADQEVLHTWKCNSLLLRFWVNIIKNPEFVFDIHKSPIVDSCLSIIAQTFMDSCSIHDQRLGKDSPSTKLLYAKDIPRYRHLVNQFYKSINDMPPVDDSHMSHLMKEQSKTSQAVFNRKFALQELFKYTKQYNLELLEALEDNPNTQKDQLSKAFAKASASMECLNNL